MFMYIKNMKFIQTIDDKHRWEKSNVNQTSFLRQNGVQYNKNEKNTLKHRSLNLNKRI